MSKLKYQVNKLKCEFEKYNKTLELLVLDNGEELKFRGKDLFSSLSDAIASNYDNRIVRALKDHEIVRYTGDGNMPQLIKCVLRSRAIYDMRKSLSE
jgi:hypothetical protein